MNVQDAINEACAAVGIQPPRSYKHGQWAKCDTLDGKSGKGDGRIIVDDLKVTAFNWKAGENATIWLRDRGDISPAEKRQFAERRQQDDQQRRARAEAAAGVAQRLVAAATLQTHAYLARKGFRDEQALTITADAVRGIGGDYLVAGQTALIMPARIDGRLASVQLIWEDGTKKFLAGGEIQGTSHRIGKGADTWLCEGYATGLSLRAVLRALNRADTILCCFSASNVKEVARSIQGRCLIAADHDKPLEQFGGLGTGEHYAQASSRPYTMPPEVGTDFNDWHQAAGIFALQRQIARFIREARR